MNDTKLMNLLQNEGLKRTHVILLRALRKLKVSEKGKALSYKEIAEVSGLSRESVVTARDYLERKKYIKTKEQKRTQKGRHSSYKIYARGKLWG